MSDDSSRESWVTRLKQSQHSAATQKPSGSGMLVWIGEPSSAEFPEHVLEDIVSRYGLRGITKLQILPAVLFEVSDLPMQDLCDRISDDYPGLVDAFDPGYGFAMSRDASRSPSL